MADQGRWFKVWCSTLLDPHLSILPLEDYARWVKLGVLIKEQGSDGVLTVTEPGDPLCYILKITPLHDAILQIKKLPNVVVTTVTDEPVTYQVKFNNWHKYQGDFSGDRVRKFRAKKAQNETTKKRREEKRREENIKESIKESPAPVSLEQKEEKKEPPKHPQNSFQEIIDYLNKKTGRNFRLTETYARAMRARMSEGFTKENFKTVIDNQVQKWNTDEKMREFLRPETLFSNKFQSYLQIQAIDWRQKVREAV